MSEETENPVEFYLLDLRYRPAERCDPPRADAPLMVWWGPNDSGYGNSLAPPWVGRYSPERIAAHPDYYRLGERMLAIPRDMAHRVAVPKPKSRKGWGDWCDGPGPVVPNHSLVWDHLEDVAWSMDQIAALLKVQALGREVTDA